MRLLVATAITLTMVMAFLPLGSRASSEQAYVIGAVGDVAGDHLPDSSGQRNHMDKVANLALLLQLKYLLVAGDCQHNFGTIEEYMSYYGPAFGSKVDSITYPVVGNHDYYKSGTAAGFFDYFNTRLDAIQAQPIVSMDSSGRSLGYYSFNLGTWHIVALNSELIEPGYSNEASWNDRMYFGPGTPEYAAEMTWLQNDLVAYGHSGQTGLIAFWHHPFTYDTWMKPVWDLLYKYGCDIVLNGHDHNYQRWAKMNPDQVADPNGIREFVVGTGGYYDNSLLTNGDGDNGFQNGVGHYNLSSRMPSTFQFGQDTQFGLMQLTLHRGSYDFKYIAIDGKVLDQGSKVPVNGHP